MQSDEKTKTTYEKANKRHIVISEKNHINLSKLKIQAKKNLNELADEVVSLGIPEYKKQENL